MDSMTTPLPEVVDNCISQCPIDYRRRLYSNIVLSGGSTAFQHFKEAFYHARIHVFKQFSHGLAMVEPEILVWILEFHRVGGIKSNGW